MSEPFSHWDDLLPRQPITINDEKTCRFYRDKTILITGGGGSIGSALCRQLAAMQPRALIILDVYENGAYEIQQELSIAHPTLKTYVEIVSICDCGGLARIMADYRPDILLHAAAHKHVPLMEHNCCEAIKNNIFGTCNTLELAEQAGVSRFILISTDKAVNPTSVMGATKRMCEMIVLGHKQNDSGMVTSAVRFGNVLASAGSVVQLFQRQIQYGGPVTITDKRIIRYFMTLSEASQLVLQAGMMAERGELFVLDMGEPIRILDLAEKMIRLNGHTPYTEIDIVETGLRPGEKLYEELLINPGSMRQTENHLIYIEQDQPLAPDALREKLQILHSAAETNDNPTCYAALKAVVPGFRAPSDGK